MQAAIVRTTIDRGGRQIMERIIIRIEVNEDAFYRPLVEILGEGILASCKEEREKRVG